MQRQPALLVPFVLVAIALAACGGSTSPSPSAAGPSTPASSTPASVAPSQGGVDSPDEAAAAVLAADPRFAELDLKPQDPDMIGQCCWYEVTENPDGYQVVLHVGWGDCPSGCINRHTWTYSVTPDGEVAFVREEGVPIPAGPFPPQDGVGG